MQLLVRATIAVGTGVAGNWLYNNGQWRFVPGGAYNGAITANPSVSVETSRDYVYWAYNNEYNNDIGLSSSREANYADYTVTARVVYQDGTDQNGKPWYVGGPNITLNRSGFRTGFANFATAEMDEHFEFTRTGIFLVVGYSNRYHCGAHKIESSVSSTDDSLKNQGDPQYRAWFNYQLSNLVFNPQTGSWSALPTSISTARAKLSATRDDEASFSLVGSNMEMSSRSNVRGNSRLYWSLEDVPATLHIRKEYYENGAVIDVRNVDEPGTAKSAVRKQSGTPL